MQSLKNSAKKIIPKGTRKFLRRLGKPVFLYLLSGSTKPLSDWHGFDRGTPLDRHYIEGFLETHKSAIKGRCLEVFDNAYTLRYGKDTVSQSDVLDIEAGNANATIIADLRNMPQIQDNTYDAIILTQVLQFIDNPESVIHECHRILKPQGKILTTLPCLSRMDRMSGTDADFWRFTKAGAEVLFKKSFSNLKIESYGNVRSGILSLIGASLEEVSSRILKTNDPQFPLIISVMAEK